MQLTRRAVARGRYQAGHLKSGGREPSQEDWVQRVGSYIVRVFRDAIEKLTDHEKTTEKENMFLKVRTRTIATNTPWSLPADNFSSCPTSLALFSMVCVLSINLMAN